ncbi:hypothetical protein UAY_02740 [Enterococcus moraviensis ATCC BAA-383]|uniref:OmpR/PhoB-type domain-containing protein n=1 Tax=Enterococcus moraviensis ATCC BAA-383 TaxID=1158609 RepID=R2QP63_9ENTE|nr:winged helix-turn-helix domain-containing protein [Enterococcus moraviensis]EOH97008.1 hypothetical protein UAY_02740 [Enterococcus moraviensis ATCC BAA-383]EOT65798.1 hypothetical protein I586_02067 [Enterococcus moraviensis ATCC BAA-383]OJG68430.1 hypothetical protein RV09_GL001677 [Enterococcus moraviensis]
MIKLGFVCLGSEESINIKGLSIANGYEYTLVEDKNECMTKDVLVINVGSENYFLETCEWLLAIQKAGLKFVWLILSEINKQELEVYLQLGINGWINSGDEDSQLFQLMRNTIRSNDFKDRLVSQENGNGELALNRNNLSVKLNNGKEISLTNQEFQILMLLKKKENQTVSYEEIGVSLWEEKYEKYRVTNTIFHLRNKLGIYGKDYIQTVRTKGYRLIAAD